MKDLFKYRNSREYGEDNENFGIKPRMEPIKIEIFRGLKNIGKIKLFKPGRHWTTVHSIAERYAGYNLENSVNGCVLSAFISPYDNEILKATNEEYPLLIAGGAIDLIGDNHGLASILSFKPFEELSKAKIIVMPPEAYVRLEKLRILNSKGKLSF